MKVFGVIVLLMLSAGGLAGCEAPATVTQAEKVFQCPMHAKVRSSKAINCSVCGMKLVHKDTLASSAGSATAATLEAPTSAPATAQEHDHDHDHTHNHE